MDKRKKVIIAVVLILTVIILVTYFEKPRVKTTKVVTTIYENKVEFKGIYFTQEKVIYEGDIDKAELRVKDGEKIPSGINVYKNLYSNEAGVICTHIDGYENKFNADNVEKVGLKEIENIEDEGLKSGIKVINNSEWFIFASLDKKEIFKKGRSYDLSIDNYLYPAQIVKVYDKPERKFVLFKIKYDLNILNLHRNINGYIIKSRYNGIVVPDKAVININGMSGVLVKAHDYAEFRNVSVLFEGNGTAVINPGSKGKKLQEYDDVILNPGSIKDGTKIR